MKNPNYYLSKARAILGDKIASGTENRWDSTDLLDFLNRGIEEIFTFENLAKGSRIIVIQDGKPHLALTEFALSVSRAELRDGAFLPFITRKELDVLDSKWSQLKGKPEALIYDQTDVGNLQIFPIPKDAELDITHYPPTAMGGEYTDTYLGQDLSPNEIELQGATHTDDFFGIPTIVGASAVESWEVRIFYNRRAKEYTDQEEIDVDSRLQTALIHFIVHEALLLGNDTENRDLGMLYYKKFRNRIEQLDKLSNDRGGDRMDSSTYNTGFNLDAFDKPFSIQATER